MQSDDRCAMAAPTSRARKHRAVETCHVAVMFLRQVILILLQDHALALWVSYAAWISLDSFMMETKMTPTTMDPANTSSEGVKDP